MRELEERQSELDRLIIIERSKMQVKVSAEEIRTFYDTALMQESQMLINYLVKEIIVYDYSSWHLTYSIKAVLINEPTSFCIITSVVK